MIYGTVHPDFLPLRTALEKQIARHPGGAAISVYHHGEKVVDLWGGVRNEDGDPWTQDTMSVSFSTTKGAASTAIHMLVDRGLLSYDDPVVKHWPEFGQQGKENILVRHVLSHQAGLYDVRSMIESPRELLDWEHMIHLFEQARPKHAPGKHTAYHGITYGYLTGELVRRVTGIPFTRFVEEEMAQPLGLDGFHVGVPRERLGRVAKLIKAPKKKQQEQQARKGKVTQRRGSIPTRMFWSLVRGGMRVAGLHADLTETKAALLPRQIGSFDFAADEVVQACIPAANGVFTARSLARFYACLANGGELDGVRLLSPKTLEAATAMQIRRADLVLLFRMHWRLGYHGVTTPRGVSKHAFGHFGYGGSGAWAHPKHNLSFAMTVNSGQGTPMGDLRIVRMSGVALRCAQRRRVT